MSLSRQGCGRIRGTICCVDRIGKCQCRVSQVSCCGYRGEGYGSKEESLIRRSVAIASLHGWTVVEGVTRSDQSCIRLLNEAMHLLPQSFGIQATHPPPNGSLMEWRNSSSQPLLNLIRKACRALYRGGLFRLDLGCGLRQDRATRRLIGNRWIGANLKPERRFEPHR